LLYSGILLRGMTKGEGEMSAGCGAVLGTVLPWRGEAGVVQEGGTRPTAAASPTSVQEE
jgi:hypothetical protein